MKQFQLFLVFVISCFSCNSQHQKINGVSFVASRDSITSAHTRPVLEVQSNYVALMPFGFIRELTSPKIIHNTSRQWFGETQKGVLQYAQKFQEAKVEVMIKPQIWVRGGLFTGNIKMVSEEHWIILENSYRDFILSYARTAQELRAAIFCIGTELEYFVKNRPTYWSKLIKEIRAIYAGKLTYAANWNEFSQVSFWEELDYVGIDAYFPLTKEKSPSISDYEKGWKPHKKAILELQQQVGKPVLFTEFGYRSVDYAGSNPWDSKQIEGGVNHEAQTNGLESVYNQFWNEDWFAGGFIWKWFHDHEGAGGDKDNRFTPQNKPAEELIKKIYKKRFKIQKTKF